MELFESKQERTVKHLIEFLRHLEKKNKGDGLKTLEEMRDEFLSEEKYNAIKPAIENIEADYSISFIGPDGLAHRRDALQRMMDKNFYEVFIKPTIKDETNT